jgi:hypothetical protein
MENKKENDMFLRNCPKCGKIICYSDIYKLNNANRRNTLCRSCVSKNIKHKKIINIEDLTRICPNCKKEIIHKNKKDCKKSIKKNLLCNSCVKKGKCYRKSFHHSEETKRLLREINIGLQSGDKNPNWKGGITPINDKLRHSTKYFDWRISVFARDNYTCKNCNKTNCVLNSHHLQPFYKIKNDEIKLYDINNGITWCKNCHDLFHRIYGRKEFPNIIAFNF